MNNAFCYSRDKENALFASLPRRIAGQCLVVMQRLLFDAAHTAGVYNGEELERGEVAISVDAIHAKTSLSIKSIRNALKNLEKCHELGKQRASQGASRPNVYVVVNYEDWDELSKKGQAELNERGKPRASQTPKGQADFIGEIEEKGKPLKEVKEVKEDTIVSSRTRNRVESSPNCEYILKLATWFYGEDEDVQHTDPVKTNSSDWWKHTDTVRLVLEKQMKDYPEPRSNLEPQDRLRSILLFAVYDDPENNSDGFGWKYNLRSLGQLTATKPGSKTPKWRKIEIGIFDRKAKESRHGNRNGRSPQGIGCTFGGMLDKYLTEDAQQEGAYVDVSPDSGELPALGPASGQ